MYYAVEMCSNEYSLNGTIRRDVRTRKFRHLHLHHFVCLPHHYRSLESSRTFQDLALKFPALSRTKPIFQDFPDLEIVPKKIQDFPGLSRSVGTLDKRLKHQLLLTAMPLYDDHDGNESMNSIKHKPEVLTVSSVQGR